MKKVILLMLSLFLVLAGCNQASVNEGNTTENTEGTNQGEDLSDQTIVFGMTAWTSTAAPTNIAKLILEEAGYNVEFTTLAQPAIFAGLKIQDVDFFMDAWLPYTEAELWNKYKNDLLKVSASYEDVPLGWVVPSYVEADSIEDLIGNEDQFNGKVYSISPGAGIVTISEDVLTEYGLDEYELVTSSETGMMAELKSSIKDEKPIIITGWRPHSMFAQFDLKFLEETKQLFKSDNVYVLSYKGIEDKYPRAYEILSKWSIEVSELEEMMLEHENEGTEFEVLAQEWIENHRDQVDEMIGK